MAARRGFVDLHCHLLPAVDDGAKTVEESLAMAKALAAVGFAEVAPSPHAWPELPSSAVAQQKREELQAIFDREGLALKLHPNAENRLDEELFFRVATGDPRALGSGGKVLLVEVPFEAPLPNLLELIFRLRLKGFTPLIAHPERCHEFQRNPSRPRQAVDAGAALQLELGALIGRYGPEAKRVAARLLDDELYAVAASDLHGPIGAEHWLTEALGTLEARVGGLIVDRLLIENPGRLLRGELP